MWSLKMHERKRMEAVEMNRLRNIWVPNVEIRRCGGKNVSVSRRIDQGVLR